MNNNKANSPAFPSTDGTTFANEGITKREYIATLNMQGLLAASGTDATSSIFIITFLGLPPETKYNYEEHYFPYLAKISLIATNALINELSKTAP